jgi:tetratricopeptide (TPR) repeat protein
MSMPLLLEYFRELPQRRADEKTSEWSRRFRAGLKQFHKLVAGRYSEGTLERLLGSAEAEVRQAAVVALGMCGSMTMSQALARMLRDDDPSVRQFADDALWSIWFRADEPANIDALQRLMRKIAEESNPAEILAEFEVLLQRCPKFAEAYNQRAIFHFRRGDFLRAIADCQKTLQLNPYHFGAANGLAQCFMKQRKYHAALRTYRRALRLNPNLDGIRETIESLEKMLGEGRK